MSTDRPTSTASAGSTANHAADADADAADPAQATRASDDLTDRAFLLLAGGDEVRLCKDIPDAACREQPGNFFRHLLASVGNKLADEIASARLVLPWLLAQMGAGSAVIGWLVPIREAGALLPQLMVAAKLRAMAQRKFAWALGGTIQGGSALGMAALAGSGVEGALGWGGVLALLTLLSLGRGISSIATKDVMGKTIAKTRRGTLMGWADSASSVIALGIGLALPLLGDRPERGMLAALLVLAGCGWLLNAVCALWMKEEPGATEGGTDAGSALKDSWQLLRDDPAFLRFNISRGLLLGSALSLPYLVVLARERSGSDLGGLGWLIVASSIGGLITSPFWGQWADRSSRHVMAAAGALAAVFVLVALALPVVMPGVAESALTYGVLYGLVATAHGGVRLGRKTWVVDAGGQQRALYVALSNTVTGVLMLVAGAVASGVSALWGNTGVLLLMAGLALVGSASTLWIQDGQAQ